MPIYNLLINNLNPYILCFQGTRFHENCVPNSDNSNIHFKNDDSQLIASGGVATFINTNCKSTELHLNTHFQAVASLIVYPLKLTLCNIYIPPRTKLCKSELLSLKIQLPTPFILCGDLTVTILFGALLI